MTGFQSKFCRIIDKKTTKIYIIMEYCQGGDLGQLLKKCRKEKDYISEDVVLKLIRWFGKSYPRLFWL